MAVTRAQQQNGVGTDRKENRLVAHILGDLCQWIHSLAVRDIIDVSLPFHELLITGLRAETEEFRVAEMKEKVVLLDAKLEEIRRAEGIGDRSVAWQSYMVRPGDKTGQRLEFREVYPGDFNSPIAFAAAQLRRPPEATNGLAIAQ